MENRPNNRIIEIIHSGFHLLGEFLNGFIVFLNSALGNIGKLLSTGIIIFTAYIIWVAFHGQIDNMIPLPDLHKTSTDELIKIFELRRAVYKGAIESVAGPLATLVGAVVSVIGIGITVQKFINKTDTTTGQNTTTVEQDQVIIPNQQKVAQVSEPDKVRYN